MTESQGRALRSHVAGSAAVAAGFFVALVVLLLFNMQQTPAPGDPVPEPSPTQTAPSQQTLLVQVTLARLRAASLLMATGGDPDTAVMASLPSDLLLVDGPVYTPLLDANLSLNRRLTAQAAANTLGVRVDGGWRMERKALAGLIDAVGGVSVSVAAPTVYLDESGNEALALPPGPSVLTGPQASWYVMGVVAGEDPIAGVQARLAEVFPKAVMQLPDNADEIAAILTSLGALSDPLNGTREVAEQLLALRANFLAQQVTPVVLPLRPSSPADPVVTRNELQGGPAAAVGAFRVTDYVTATPTLREVFRQSPRVADVDGPPRVLVWNASGEPLATKVALLELTDADFVALSAGPWDGVQAVTRINGIGYSMDGTSFSAGVAEALRLVAPEEFGDTGTLSPTPSPSPSASPEAATMPPPDRAPWADVDVVFGQDYQPCPPDEPNCLAVEAQ